MGQAPHGHILIVEDSAVQAKLLKRVLETAGYQASHASNGLAALEQVNQSRPDLIISDINMPHMNGYAMCQRLKQEPTTQEILVILLSDLSNIQEIVLGLEARADNYILKPFEKEDLLTIVHEILSCPEQRQNLRIPARPHPFMCAGGINQIASNRQQILNFLISVYGSVIKKNKQLLAAQTDLRLANERILESERNYSALVQTVPDIIYRLDQNGHFVFINHAIEKLGYSTNELLGKHFSTIIADEHLDEISRALVVERIRITGQYPSNQPKLFDEQRTGDRKTTDLEVKFRLKGSNNTMDGQIEIAHGMITGEVNSAGILAGGSGHTQALQMGTVGVIRDITERKLVEAALNQANKDLITSLNEVARSNQKIMESLEYAEKIQRSLLPNPEVVRTLLPDSFFIWEPRDIVGGDIYFVEPVEHGIIVAVMDCTGHGVPGALMTMIAATSLKRIIVDEHYRDPGAILQRLNGSVKSALRQDSSAGHSDDGLDGVICFFNPSKRRLIFAGARLPLLHIQDGQTEIQITRGDRHSIGYRKSDVNFVFTNHELTYKERLCVYLFSDGVVDQQGGPKRMPFGKTRLTNILADNVHHPFTQQEHRIRNAFNTYSQDQPRLDDVTLIGIRIS
jgi:PAS domain S-box-containing protein